MALHYYNLLSGQEKKVSFKDNYNSDTLYITKMGRTLLPKFPRDQDERLWKYIRVLLLGPNDDSDIEDPLLIRPPNQQQLQPAASAAASTIPSSTSVSLSSMTLNGGGGGMNGSSSMMSMAGVIGPRHNQNSKSATLTLVSSSNKNKVSVPRNNFCPAYIMPI